MTFPADDFQQLRYPVAGLLQDRSTPHTLVQLFREAQRQHIASQKDQSPHCGTETDSCDEAIACVAAESALFFQPVDHEVPPLPIGELLSRAAPSLLVASHEVQSRDEPVQSVLAIAPAHWIATEDQYRLLHQLHGSQCSASQEKCSK